MTAKVQYREFQPLKNVQLALKHLTSMVDNKVDNLPYWLVYPNAKPAFAEHSRTDDMDTPASWYEAIVSAQQMLGTDDGKEVKDSLRRHLMNSWGEQGLRFHEPYPWNSANGSIFHDHCSFHDMAYVLSALNRMIANNPDDKEASRRAAKLVRGMRKLAIHRKGYADWITDRSLTELVYEFPNDVYFKDRGFDLATYSGRGNQVIFNGAVLLPLVQRYDATGDEVALDLAIGLANYLLGTSRYFNYKMEFFGHVHSTVWVASGLVRLGRLLKEQRYIENGRMIYEYARSISSRFGWVPELAQQVAPTDVLCETCCIKDMIECASELINAGYDEFYDDLNRFARNQLVENQCKISSFVVVDNAIEDTEARTYREINKRILGGFSGWAAPGNISFSHSVCGCCTGTAVQALQIFWDRAVEYRRGLVTVNMPVDKTIRQAEVAMGYPNEGYIRVNTKQPCDVAIRLHSWMPNNLEGFANGRRKTFDLEGNLAVFRNIPKNGTVELRHALRSRKVKEIVRGRSYIVTWRGPDVVNISPHGDGIRLYQRDKAKSRRRFKPTASADDKLRQSVDSLRSSANEQR